MACNDPQVVGRFNAHNLLLVAVLFGIQVFKPWAALLNPRKMYNLFHYDKEGSPGYECARILEKWDVVKNKHLLHEALDDYFRSRLVMRTNRKLPPPNALWRITIPVWAVAFLLIAFVVLPIRWLFTGEYKLDHRTGAFGWLRSWHQRIFPWPKP